MDLISPPVVSQPKEGALGPYLRAIRAHRLLVALVVLAALAGSIAFLLLRSASYEATANLLVNPLPQDDQTFLGLQLLRDSPGDPTRTVQTAASLVESREAAIITARRVGGGTTPQEVLDAIEVRPQGESNILAVTATADSADRAAQLANEFAAATLQARGEALRDQVTAAIARLEAEQEGLANAAGPRAVDLASRLNQLQALRDGDDPTLSVSERAISPTSATGPPAALVIPLALVAGLALGSGAALLLELLDRRIRDEEDAVGLYPLPILARVPVLPKRRRRGPDPGMWFMPPEVREAFRTLLVQFERRGSSTPAIMVTSASTGDGKTTSAINLAVAISASGDSVVLLDFDVRKPDIGRTLGIEATDKPVSILNPKTRLRDLLVPGQPPSLSVLALSATEATAVLVEAMIRRLPELLEEARELADWVVIDTPPLGEVSDALRLAHGVDDIILVARPGNTNRGNLQVVRDLLTRAGKVPKGYLVIGETPLLSSGYYGHGLSPRELMLPASGDAVSAAQPGQRSSQVEGSR